MHACPCKVKTNNTATELNELLVTSENSHAFNSINSFQSGQIAKDQNHLSVGFGKLSFGYSCSMKHHPCEQSFNCEIQTTTHLNLLHVFVKSAVWVSKYVVRVRKCCCIFQNRFCSSTKGVQLYHKRVPFSQPSSFPLNSTFFPLLYIHARSSVSLQNGNLKFIRNRKTPVN